MRLSAHFLGIGKTVGWTAMPEGLFSGVGVALLTLFGPDGALDATGTGKFAARLVDAGISGVIIAGSTGEASTLDAFERADLVRAVREATEERVPVFAGTGAPSVRQAIAYTVAALDAGADGFLVLSPPGAVDLARYYREIVGVAAGRPVLAYHFPAVSAPGIPLDTLRELPVDGVKDSSGDPDRLLDEVTTFDGALYTGSSALLSYAGPLGCKGAILALANAEPELCIAAFSGDPAAQRSLAPSHRASRMSFPRGIKALAAERYGIFASSRLG